MYLTSLIDTTTAVNPFSKYTKKGEEQWEGCVAVATSRRHWSEEYIVVSRQSVSWAKNKDIRRRSTHTIPMSSGYTLFKF